MRLSVLLALFGALLLQVWRPFFHLNDDNMTGWMPVAVEMYRKLWTGHWPFVNTSLFGGDYQLLQDPTVFGLLSPWALICSWIALTDYYFWLPDLISTLNLLTIAGCFAWFVKRMREEFNLEISDGMIVFATLSYTFTPFNLLVGGSWIGFLNAQASLPLIVAGIYSRTFRRGVGLMTAAMVYAIYGSHLHPFIFLLVFAGVFVGGIAVAQRSIQPAWRFSVSAALSCLAAAPILISSFLGFATSDRHEALTLTFASAYRLPVANLAASFVGGSLSSGAVSGIRIHYSDPAFNLSLAFALINIPLLVLLCSKRKFTLLEALLGGCALLAGLFIVRPDWLGNLLLQLPLFKSLRWPFREIALLHFFTHFLFILNVRRVSLPLQKVGLGVGALAYGMLFLLPPPTFNPLAADRELLITGKARRFWQVVRGRLGDAPIVCAAPPQVLLRYAEQVPFTLLGAYNYASVFGIVNTSGYSPTLPASSLVKDLRPYHHAGIFTMEGAGELLATRPELTRVTLLHVNPTIIQIASGSQKLYFRFDAATLAIEEVHPPQPLPPNF